MKLIDWVAFLLLGLIWGSSYLWIKVAVQEIGPFILVALRLLIGVVGLLVVMAARRPPLPRSRGHWISLAALGFTNPAFPFVLISWGQQYIDSGVASILNGVTPLFTLLIAHLFLHDEQITLTRLLGLFSGLVGVIVLMSRDLGQEAFRSSVFGQLAVLVAAASYAASSVIARRNLRTVTPLVQAFLSMSIADALVWLAVPLFETPVRFPSLAVTWLGLVWLGLLGSFIAYLLFFYLIQSIGATRTMMVTYVIPVLGVALGVIFLQERLDWQLVAGTLFVGGGVWVVNSNLQLRRRSPEPVASK